MRGWFTWTMVSGPSVPAARAAAKISRGATLRYGMGSAPAGSGKALKWP